MESIIWNLQTVYLFCKKVQIRNFHMESIIWNLQTVYIYFVKKCRSGIFTWNRSFGIFKLYVYFVKSAKIHQFRNWNLQIVHLQYKNTEDGFISGTLLGKNKNKNGNQRYSGFSDIYGERYG